MDEIKLTAEQRSITDIFKTSFPSWIDNTNKQLD
jgi:hypothetical protein